MRLISSSQNLSNENFIQRTEIRLIMLKNQIFVGCFLIWVSSIFIFTIQALTNQVVQFTPYEDVKVGKKFSEASFFLKLSQSDCAKRCNRTPKCRSFSVCKGFRCLLHYDDVYSTEYGDQILVDGSSCIYIGVQRMEETYCEEIYQTEKGPENTEKVSIHTYLHT